MVDSLYICYFGLREPLVQTQVVPYLREIAAQGFRPHLLTFDPAGTLSRPDRERERRALSESGIEWHSLTYHKRFSALATAYDIMRGAVFIRGLVRRRRIALLHARAHIPLAMALMTGRSGDVPLIFDIRGLMAEEYVDAGIWRERSIPFRVIKWIERVGLRRAGEIVVLTEKFKNYLVDNRLRDPASVTVIPCCVDPSRANGAVVEKSESFELIYAGSVTGLYMLKEMGQLFMVLKEKRSDAFFRILTAGDPEYVRRVFSEIGLPEDSFSVQKSPPGEVFKWIARSRAAISFRKPTFSQIAASPTKIGEYLACGVPVIVNSGIGDTDDQLREDGTGVAVDRFGSEEYERAAGDILELVDKEGIEETCGRAAKQRFDLRDVGGARYAALYRKLLNQ